MASHFSVFTINQVKFYEQSQCHTPWLLELIQIYTITLTNHCLLHAHKCLKHLPNKIYGFQQHLLSKENPTSNKLVYFPTQARDLL